MPPRLWVVPLASRSFRHLALGPFLDPAELVGPEALVHPHPVVHRPQLLRVEPVQAKPAALARRHDADLTEHGEVLGDGLLRHPEPFDHLPHRVGPPIHENLEDRAPARLGNGVEDVRCGRRSWHHPYYIPIWAYGNRNLQRAPRYTELFYRRLTPARPWSNL